MANTRERLIGCWRMVDWKVILDNGVEDDLPPLGKARDGGGILIYGAAGMMSAMLSRQQRPPFLDGSLDGGTVEERAAAFQTIISYAGTFEVDEEKGEVTHIVSYATHPNLVGQRMLRICIFSGDRLKLDTPSMIMGGKSRASHIEWERVSGP